MHKSIERYLRDQRRIKLLPDQQKVEQEIEAVKTYQEISAVIDRVQTIAAISLLLLFGKDHVIEAGRAVNSGELVNQGKKAVERIIFPCPVPLTSDGIRCSDR